MAKGRKTGGRKKGTPNKLNGAIASRCRALIEDPAYQETFAKRFLTGRLPPVLEAMAWHYAYGKPSETMTLQSLGGGPISILHKHVP